jgi:hypothetical protein
MNPARVVKIANDDEIGFTVRYLSRTRSIQQLFKPVLFHLVRSDTKSQFSQSR